MSMLNTSTDEGHAFEASIQLARQQEQCQCATCLFLRAMGQALDVPEITDEEEP